MLLARRLVAARSLLTRANQASRASSRSVTAILREFLLLRAATGMTAQEYFLYEVYRSIPYTEKLQYLTRHLHETYLAPLDPPEYGGLISDKMIFHRYMTGAGLRMPAWYGLYHPSIGVTSDDKPLRTLSDLSACLSRLPAGGLVIKPAIGGCGVGVLVFAGRDPYAGDALLHVDGSRFDLQRLSKALQPVPSRPNAGFLLEERVRQNPFLERFNQSTLHTTRVVTIQANSGAIMLGGAALKIGMDSSGVESLAHDHLVVPVDLETGRLGAGALRHGETFSRVAVHPPTGLRLEGETLPFWRETCQLAVHAARLAGRVRSVGWDIGLAVDGPILIEGNEIWGEEILQLAHGRGLWTPEFRGWIGVA